MIHIYERPRLFEVRPYEEDVLQLADGMTEIDLEEQVRAEANGVGICIDPVEQQHARTEHRGSIFSSAGSAYAVSTDTPRTHSIDSRNSFSTDFASNQSRSSRDYRRSNIFSLPLRPFSRTSSRNGDIDNRSSLPSTPRSFSISSLSMRSPRSSTSFTPSYNETLRKPFSVRRHLRLSKFRRSNQQAPNRDGLPVCSRCLELGLQTQPEFRMQCGHCFCQEHLLQIIGERALGAETGLSSCCRRQISEPLIDAVLSYSSCGTAPSTVADSTWACVDYIRPGTTTTAAELPETLVGSKQPSTALQCLGAACERHLELALSIREFSQLRHAQARTLERFSTFREKLLSSQKTHHIDFRAERIRQHEQQMAELRDAHGQTLSKLEDKHLAAEIDLRGLHEQETANCALALRHMEGYMRTHDPDGSGKNITEQDKRELEKQYWLRENMESRHNSAINVLREQQARVSRTRIQTQEKEAAVLELKFQREMSHLDRTFETEAHDLEDLIAARKCRLRVRFGLMDEIWRRQHNSRVEEETIQEDDVATPGKSKISFPIPPVRLSPESKGVANTTTTATAAPSALSSHAT